MSEQQMGIIGVGLIVVAVIIGAVAFVLQNDDSEGRTDTIDVGAAVDLINTGAVARFNLQEDPGGGSPTITLYFNDGRTPAVLLDPPPSQQRNFIAWLQDNGASITAMAQIDVTFDD